MSYLQTTHDIYKDAALTPDIGLCCTTNPIWELPGLKIPKIMQEMNYGCGSTVNARDLTNNPKTLYVGVGGGMESLVLSSVAVARISTIHALSSSKRGHHHLLTGFPTIET